MDIKAIQTRLGLKADGVAGPKTYAALFEVAAGRPLGEIGSAMGARAAIEFPRFGITTALRLSHFLAQAAHETEGFRYFKEIWGPTAAQRGYERRADLGNTHPGDGRRMSGRGIFQLTGRANYFTMGKILGIDLVSDPDRAALPDLSVTIACHYWDGRKINAAADRDDVAAVTRKINGGHNGLPDRKARLAKIRKVIGC